MTGTVLDERGRPCPLPIIALGRALRTLPSGEQVTLLADDPVAATDVPAWCSLVGARLIEAHEGSDGVFRYLISLP